jgi:membrane-associated phospholipid phosphatase
VEIFIFACGYAFNPAMFPWWLGGIHALSRYSLENGPITTYELSDMFWRRWREYLQSINTEKGALVNTAFYFASVLVTLVFTELGKASFATTRPQSPMRNNRIKGNQNGNSNLNNNAQQYAGKRRYGSLASSLKSKHSFPSGDCAQAMNLCMFLYRFVPVPSPRTTLLSHSIRDYLMFGLFIPGVAFARVFYWCHWIEDCIGGALLAILLHWLLIPTIGETMIQIIKYR